MCCFHFRNHKLISVSLSDFSTQNGVWYYKSFHLKDRALFIVHIEYHGCWCPGDPSSFTKTKGALIFSKTCSWVCSSWQEYLQKAPTTTHSSLWHVTVNFDLILANSKHWLCCEEFILGKPKTYLCFLPLMYFEEMQWLEIFLNGK